MEKPAPADHAILDLLRRRWSPHSFAPKLIEPDKVDRIFEAARWAMSSFNEQPWSYVVATKDHPDDWQQMLSCLTDSNQLWAKTAPLLAISVASLSFSHNGKPNRVAIHDVGAASAFLTIQATAEGLFVHQMAGFDVEKAKSIFRIPSNHEPVAAMAIGYPGDVNNLPDAVKQRTLAPRQRKPVNQFVFTGKWGQPRS